MPDDVHAFAIITGYATTGETWPDEENERQNDQLRLELEGLGVLLGKMTGYSPTEDHAEPGWAAVLEFDQACDIGAKYDQAAIYYVRDGVLYLSYCDTRRELVNVGAFAARFEVDA